VFNVFVRFVLSWETCVCHRTTVNWIVGRL
jgi:hypothetical protein